MPATLAPPGAKTVARWEWLLSQVHCGRPRLPCSQFRDRCHSSYSHCLDTYKLTQIRSQPKGQHKKIGITGFCGRAARPDSTGRPDLIRPGRGHGSGSGPLRGLCRCGLRIGAGRRTGGQCAGPGVARNARANRATRRAWTSCVPTGRWNTSRDGRWICGCRERAALASGGRSRRSAHPAGCNRSPNHPEGPHRAQ